MALARTVRASARSISACACSHIKTRAPRRESPARANRMPSTCNTHVSTRPTERPPPTPLLAANVQDAAAGWVARARWGLSQGGSREVSVSVPWAARDDTRADVGSSGRQRPRWSCKTAQRVCCDRPLPRLQSGWRGLHMHARSDTATRWCPPLPLLVLPWPRAAIRGKLLGQEGREGLQGCHDDQEQGEDRAVRVGPQK